jgi:hypothetical protein
MRGSIRKAISHILFIGIVKLKWKKGIPANGATDIPFYLIVNKSSMFIPSLFLVLPVFFFL